MKPHFWRKPIYPPESATPLTDEMVKAAEAKLGVKLPQSYIDLLKTQNGGYTNYDCHAAPREEKTQTVIWVQQIIGIYSQYDIFESTQNVKNGSESFPHQVFVVTDGTGHDGVFLDYRACGTNGEPSVIWIDYELSKPFEYKLAPDFATFLDGLFYGFAMWDHIWGFVIQGMLEADMTNQINSCLGIKLKKDSELLCVTNYMDDVKLGTYSSGKYDYFRLTEMKKIPSEDFLRLTYPQCNWMFEADLINFEDANLIETKLKSCFECEIIKLHTGLPPKKR